MRPAVPLVGFPGQKEPHAKPNLPKGTQPADPIMVRVKAGRAGMRVPSGTLQGLCCPGEIVRFVPRTRYLCVSGSFMRVWPLCMAGWMQRGVGAFGI